MFNPSCELQNIINDLFWNVPFPNWYSFQNKGCNCLRAISRRADATLHVQADHTSFIFWNVIFLEFVIFGTSHFWNFTFLEFHIYGISYFWIFIEYHPIVHWGSCGIIILPVLGILLVAKLDNPPSTLVFLGPRESYSRSKNI